MYVDGESSEASKSVHGPCGYSTRTGVVFAMEHDCLGLPVPVFSFLLLENLCPVFTIYLDRVTRDI